MDVFLATELTIPVLQIVLLLGLSSLSLFFGRIKLALLINYCFTMYWGFLSHLDLFVNKETMTFDKFFFAYLGFGLLTVIMALIGFVYYRD